MIKNFYKKKNQQTSYFSFYHYFFLLFGFFGGNLWGSFFSSFYLPPFFFVIGILLCLEILSYIYYKKIAFPFPGLFFDTFACSLSPRPTGLEGLCTSFWQRPGTISRLAKAFRHLLSAKSFVVRSRPKDFAESRCRKALATGFNDFQLNQPRGFSKKKMKFTNDVYKSSLFIQNRNKSLYLLKVGLVFGLFVDAFKVGS